MERTLKVLNDLEQTGIIRRYAIGGAIAALFYIQPFDTEDLDVFVFLDAQNHPLMPLKKIYEELRKRGYVEDGPYLRIEGVPVQFLLPYNPLIEEAIEQAVDVCYESTTTHIFKSEHLAAIMVQTGRTKDRYRLELLQEQAYLDNDLLRDILTRYHLMERFKAWTT